MSHIGPKPLRRRDLADLVGSTGSNFAVVEPTHLADDVAIRGDFRMLQLRSGIMLHATDTVDVCDLITRVEHEPTLIALLFLEGAVNMSLGNRDFRLGPGWHGKDAAPEGLLLSMTEPDLFVRHARRGNHVRKVTVSVTPDWLDGDGTGNLDPGAELKAFRREHLAEARWRLSPRVVALVENILAPSPLVPLLRQLHQETQALEILTDALQAATGRAELVAESRIRDARLGGREQARLRRVQAYLEAHAGDQLSLETIARDVGMSVSVMQRLFHAAFGTSVFDYTRGQRMERARLALIRDQVSVTEAAEIAGYAGPANFATAFKRRFGFSPSAARRSHRIQG